jgi:hypothetical protein
VRGFPNVKFLLANTHIDGVMNVLAPVDPCTKIGETAVNRWPKEIDQLLPFDIRSAPSQQEGEVPMRVWNAISKLADRGDGEDLNRG